MAARGYGGGPFTALPEPPAGRRGRFAVVAGLALLGLAIALVAGLLPYAVYPQAEPLLRAPALIAAAAVVVVCAVAAHAQRGGR
jgi:hypothetical protein